MAGCGGCRYRRVVVANLASPLGETAVMARPTPEQIEQRRQRAAEAEGLGGWFMHTLYDGKDEHGQHLSWYGYSHSDGRTALVSSSGQATDPELQAFLDASPATSRPPKPDLPRWLERKALIQLMVRVVTIIQWTKGALVGKPSRTP